MNPTLWDATLAELRARTASSSPTPGGGSVAAIAATLGCSLVQMAIDVTVSSGRRGTDEALDLSTERETLESAADRMAAAADGDVAAFETLMSAYRLPRDTDEAKASRRDAVRTATHGATEVPLALAEACADVVARTGALADAVSPSIVSDVYAGRDLLVGASGAALRTVAINVPSLDADTAAEVARRVGRIEQVVPQVSGIVEVPR